MKRNISIALAVISALTILCSCGSAGITDSDSSSSAYTTKSTSSLDISEDSSEEKTSQVFDDSSLNVSEDSSKPDTSEISADSSSSADSSLSENTESNTPMTFDDIPNGPGGLNQPPAVRPSEGEDRKEFTDDGRPIVYFRQDGDQSLISEDGSISQSFEYTINEEENCVDFTFVTVNNSDQIFRTNGKYACWALTDKTDYDTVFNTTTEKRVLAVSPGKSKTETVSLPIPEDWSIMKICVILAPDTDFRHEYVDEEVYETIFDEDATTVYLGSASYAIEITR